jgi:nucleotide-binding universal stress UspA family protein
MTGVPTSIELKAGEFSSLMEDFMRRHVFDFVVMGVTGSNAFEQVFGTSRAVEVIARSNTPVLIVPPMANFTKIEHAGLAVELHHVDEMLPFDVIDKWLHWLQPVVHIAHVNEHRSNTITDEEKAELKKLTDRFILFNPQTHLLHGEGFVDALNHMCVKQGIELLITFPQKHSFFNLLFRTSHTRQLVFYSKVPVLALPHSAES